jgi:hypothetical protein
MWAHHLMTMKAEIINKVNNYFAEKVLKDITFTAGYLKREKNEEPKDIHELPAATHILLSHEEVAQIEELVTTISDETLKDKFRKIIRKDAALKRVKHNQGWVKCNTCGVLCPPGEIICTICKLDKKEEHKNKLRQLIKQVPWLTYKECCQYADCVISDYITIKEELKDALLREIVAGKNERIACATLLMLHHNLQPEALSEEKISELLNRIRGKKNVSAFRF